MLKNSVKVILAIFVCFAGAFISHKMYNYFNQDFTVAFMGGSLTLAIAFIIDLS